MWWECADCGWVVELVESPRVCAECGTAGAFVPARDPSLAGAGEIDRQRWFELGYEGRFEPDASL